MLYYACAVLYLLYAIPCYTMTYNIILHTICQDGGGADLIFIITTTIIIINTMTITDTIILSARTEEEQIYRRYNELLYPACVSSVIQDLGGTA